MQILTEIVELSHEIVDTLDKNNFFEENPFIDKHYLTRDLQWTMQRKWEEQEEMILTDKEFLELCNKVNEAGIAETLESLVDKNALDMSVNENGEILYSRNPNFNLDDL